MKTARVIVGTEKSKGASMMMSKASSIAEKSRRQAHEAKNDEDKGVTLIDLENMAKTFPDEAYSVPREFENILPLCPMPIDKVDDRVYIGNKIGAEEIAYLRNNGITHILNTANELPNYHESTTGLKYMKLQLTDDPRPSVDNLLIVLEPTYKFINTALETSPRARVLVHCAAGVSRSASIVIYYLMKKYGMKFDDALARLRKSRSIVNPNDWYKSQLRNAETVMRYEKGRV